jgi:hypothetical protein
MNATVTAPGLLAAPNALAPTGPGGTSAAIHGCGGVPVSTHTAQGGGV